MNSTEMNSTELKLVLELHEKWLNGLEGGERANLTGVDLSNANLRCANLGKAILRFANLSESDLIHANLSDANLIGASLSDANLIGANLFKANLIGADLSGADLRHTNLICTDLSSTNLTNAILGYTNLSGANLSGVKEDLFKILDLAPLEVPGLLESLNKGMVDGSTYTGECCCLVGTIANVRGCDHQSLGFKPNANRPAERWFLAISEGDTPQDHPVAKITAEWISEWMAFQPTITN